MRSRILKGAMVALAITAAACSGDDNNDSGGGDVLQFVGTVNGDNGSLSGSITLSVDGSTVTGEFEVVAPAAATHALTGTYNAGAETLTAAGGGYTFNGAYDGVDRLEGTMSGAASGIFVATQDENDTALAFCGSFTGDDDGVFNFTVAGSTLSGTATTTSGTVIPLDGNINGNAISIAHPNGGAALATGTRNGTGVSGTWDNGLGDSGTWSGAQCN